MTHTERDEKQDEPLDSESEPDSGESDGSKEKLPAAPASDDDSALGDTDQHSDA